MDEIASLMGLGPKSAEMLRDAGIESERELRELGPVVAFLRVRQAGFNPSKNLLWALYGALNDKPWNKLTSREREQLLAELDAM